MPLIKSAKKRVKQSLKRRARNFAVRRTLKETLRAFTDVVAAGDLKKAAEMLPTVQKAIDMAAKKNIIHPNKANRLKSQMAKRLETEEAPKKKAA